MAYQTEDEIRARNIQAMGAEAGNLFTDLHREILLLHSYWAQYRMLFGTSKATVDLLNRAAAFFFGVVEDVFWDSLLLHIARLTDDPTVGRRRRETLTVRLLPRAIAEPTLGKHVRSLVRRTNMLARFARDWRDRRIAHNDRELVQSKDAKPLEDASRDDVEKVLASFADIVNTIERHYFQSAGMILDYISPPNDARALLNQLGLARMMLDERDARLKAGEYRPEDFRHPPDLSDPPPDDEGPP